MSLKLQFASLSFGASVDQQTGNLSVFDVIEDIKTPQVPIQLQSIVIALCLEKSAEDIFNGKMMIHFLAPDGSQRVVGQGEMNVPIEQRRMKAVFRFGAFPITAFGSHRFVLSWLDASNKKIGEALLDFSVTQVTQVAQALDQNQPKPSMQH